MSKRQQKTRLVFIHAFLRLLNERDLDKITVTDIANAANYGRWAFYQYFDSKEDIAYAAFIHWMTQLDTRVITAVQDLESPDREYQSWRIIFHEFARQRLFFVRLATTNLTYWRTLAKEFLIQQFLQHMTDGRFSLMPGVHPEVAARLYVVSMMELLEYWGNNPQSMEIDVLVDEFFAFIFKHPPQK